MATEDIKTTPLQQAVELLINLHTKYFHTELAVQKYFMYKITKLW